MRDDAEDETGPLEDVALFWTKDAVAVAAEEEEAEEGGGAVRRPAFLDNEDEGGGGTVGANVAVALPVDGRWVPARRAWREELLLSVKEEELTPPPPPTDVYSSPEWSEPKRPLFINSRSDGLWSRVGGGGPSPPAQLLV